MAKCTEIARITVLHLSFNECRQWQVIKQVGEVLPHVRIAVLAQTLVVESIHLSNLSALVVTTQDSNTIFEPDLQEARPFSVHTVCCLPPSVHWHCWLDDSKGAQPDNRERNGYCLSHTCHNNHHKMWVVMVVVDCIQQL